MKETKQALLSIRRDIICGLHSGFPPCCVKFFVTKWIWNVGSKNSNKYFEKIVLAGPWYIPCPKCLKNKTFVPVKECPENCAKVKYVKRKLRNI